MKLGLVCTEYTQREIQTERGRERKGGREGGLSWQPAQIGESENRVSLRFMDHWITLCVCNLCTRLKLNLMMGQFMSHIQRDQAQFKDLHFSVQFWKVMINHKNIHRSIISL